MGRVSRHAIQSIEAMIYHLLLVELLCGFVNIITNIPQRHVVVSYRFGVPNHNTFVHTRREVGVIEVLIRIISDTGEVLVNWLSYKRLRFLSKSPDSLRNSIVDSLDLSMVPVTWLPEVG